MVVMDCSIAFYKFLMLNNLTVRWLIEKRTLLRGKEPLLVYELVMFLSRLHEGKGGAVGFFLSPTQSPSSPPNITYSVKGKEHRTLIHPLCYEVLVT